MQNLTSDSDYQCVDNIFKSGSIDEIKTAVAAFIAVAENAEGIVVWSLCHQLKNSLVKWGEPYLTAPRGSKNNAVIVSPEYSPVMLLFSCVPVNGSPNEIIDGLRKFISRCGEFIPPVYEAIATAEINRVLNAAQKAYRILDVIAPEEPVKILRFNNSHIKYNSQCGIPDDSGRAAVIFLFHPRANDVYDRVFIFAHELGHALHLALTRDIEVLPDGFEQFNRSIHVDIKSTGEGQEAFADAVALAVLNVKGLGTHFPTQFSKDISPCFARYIKGVIEKALNGHRRGS